MISREVSFKDAENGFEVKVFVETPVEYEEYDRGSKKYYLGSHPAQTGQEDHRGNEGGAQ